MYELFDYQIICMLREINKHYEELLGCTCQEYGLTSAQALILMNLYVSGSQSITGLSETLCSVKGNISPICQRLEQSGYVTRCRDESDQRILNIALTEHARSIVEQKMLYCNEGQIDMAYKDQIMHGLQLLQEYVKTKKDNQSNEMGE